MKRLAFAFASLLAASCATPVPIRIGARRAGLELRGLDRRAPREVARRITSRQTGAGEALFDRTMKDYAEPMTARQLIDVVAYLRNPKAHLRQRG